MRAFRFSRLHLLVFALTSVVAFCIEAVPCKAQQPGGSLTSSDRVDRSAYRILFRQAVAYQKLADEAEAAHEPKPYFRHILATRFVLTDDDNESLNRLAIAYQEEIDPIQKQAVEAIRRFRARFPSGIIQRGMDADPPSELAVLERQEDAITLRYRDLLRNSMREDAFQKFHANVLALFGKPL